MSIKTSLIKNTGFNLLGYFYLLLASFFSVTYLLHNLGRDTFGIYIFLMSFISLTAVLDFGISNAVVRKLSLPNLNHNDNVKTWRTSFSIYFSLALVIFFSTIALLLYLSRSMVIFNNLDRNTINYSIIILSFIVFINYLNGHFLNLPQSKQRFDIFNVKTFFVGTANTIVSAIISINFPNIATIFFVQLIFHVFTLIYMIKYSQQFFSSEEFYPHYDKQEGKELFSFGIRNFVATLAGQIENQFSNFMLGAMVSAKAITSFSIPQSIVSKGAGIISQFAQVFFPLSTSLLEKDRIKKLRSLIAGVESVTILIGIGAVILSHTVGYQFLSWWLKDPLVVELAFPILKILSFYFVLISLTPVPTALLQGLDKPQIPSFFGALTVTLEIISSLYLVPRMGALGMAYSFLGSVCLTVPAILIVTVVVLNREIVKLSYT